MLHIIHVLLVFCLLTSLTAQTKHITINATKSKVTIRNNNEIWKNAWDITPELKPDIYEYYTPNDKDKIVFITDIDSIEVEIERGKDFIFTIVLNNKDTALTQIHKIIPDYILETTLDSIYVRPFNKNFSIETISWTANQGTGDPNTIFKLLSDKDSLRLVYDFAKEPLKQNKYVLIKSPRNFRVFNMIFWPLRNDFRNGYVNENSGSIKFLIPPAFEIANILLALTSEDDQIYRDTDYYKNVIEYFSPYINHPLIRNMKLDYKMNNEFYYNFRSNSICYDLDHDSLKSNNIYFVAWGNDINNNLFLKNINLINDFIRTSNLISFLKQNSAYYEQQIKRLSQLMPIQKMWNWLENNFSSRYNSYKIIFSPLIAGSHNTQRFFWKENGKQYGEIIMFINGPNRIDVNNPNFNDTQKEVISSPIVFTEIDHNYVNPVSEKFINEIKMVLTNISDWAAPEALKWYNSPLAVFNEYMTHAAYILYAHDIYNDELFKLAKQNRTDLMINIRGFIKFDKFSNLLLNLYTNREKESTLESLYPILLQKMKSL